MQAHQDVKSCLLYLKYLSTAGYLTLGLVSSPSKNHQVLCQRSPQPIYLVRITILSSTFPLGYIRKSCFLQLQNPTCLSLLLHSRVSKAHSWNDIFKEKTEVCGYVQIQCLGWKFSTKSISQNPRLWGFWDLTGRGQTCEILFSRDLCNLSIYSPSLHHTKIVGFKGLCNPYLKMSNEKVHRGFGKLQNPWLFPNVPGFPCSMN